MHHQGHAGRAHTYRKVTYIQPGGPVSAHRVDVTTGLLEGKRARDRSEIRHLELDISGLEFCNAIGHIERRGDCTNGHRER